EGIPNITLTLYEDLNVNGVFDPTIDAPVATAVTNANGIYNFTGLAAGHYLVAVDQTDPQFPANVIPSTTNPTAVNLAAATPRTDIDFGYQPGPGFVELGTIGDFVFYDANRNGTQALN